MYIPSHFQQQDLAQMRGLVAQSPLATCIAQSSRGFEVNHLPLFWTDDRLIGHIARANDLHEVLADGCDVACVFGASSAYISPNWYPSKAETHRHVPTWNYEVVHLHGTLHFDHSDKTKRAVVGQMTKVFETQLNGADGWKMRDAPRDYMDQMLESIVAIEVRITRIEAKSKLSQNRQQADFDNVARKLEETGQSDMAARLRELPPRP